MFYQTIGFLNDVFLTDEYFLNVYSTWKVTSADHYSIHTLQYRPNILYTLECPYFPYYSDLTLVYRLQVTFHLKNVFFVLTVETQKVKNMCSIWNLFENTV